MSETEIWPTPGFGWGMPAPDDFPPPPPEDLEGLIDYEEVTPEDET
ncbi:MAG: hypothetical protein ABWZ30_05550 [Jiangellaceae bacterium]